MGEKNYRICLNTPLGARNGSLVLRETEGRVDGWLYVMNEKNRFSGVLSEDGQLTISGVIRTLISTLHYTAAGTVSGRKIASRTTRTPTRRNIRFRWMLLPSRQISENLIRSGLPATRPTATGQFWSKDNVKCGVH